MKVNRISNYLKYENTPIDKVLVDNTIRSLGIQDFEKATIREVKSVAASVENESGVEFIKLEMGIPGLPASEVGVKAQIEALKMVLHTHIPIFRDTLN